jgi:hypothetical protein
MLLLKRSRRTHVITGLLLSCRQHTSADSANSHSLITASMAAGLIAACCTLRLVVLFSLLIIE